MKWLDRWFYRKVRWAWKRAESQFPDLKSQEDQLDEIAENSNPTRSDQPEAYDRISVDVHDLNDGMRIDIKRAVGGYIITVRCPQHTNRSRGIYSEEYQTTSYVVPDDADFDENLCSILGMERLKQ